MNYDHVLDVCRMAYRRGGTGPLSTGESLTAALVLNRPDWLKEMDYTIAQAIYRIDDSTIQHLRNAEIQIGYEIADGELKCLADTGTPA